MWLLFYNFTNISSLPFLSPAFLLSPVYSIWCGATPTKQLRSDSELISHHLTPALHLPPLHPCTPSPPSTSCIALPHLHPCTLSPPSTPCTPSSPSSPLHSVSSIYTPAFHLPHLHPCTPSSLSTPCSPSPPSSPLHSVSPIYTPALHLLHVHSYPLYLHLCCFLSSFQPQWAKLEISNRQKKGESTNTWKLNIHQRVKEEVTKDI